MIEHLWRLKRESSTVSAGWSSWTSNNYFMYVIFHLQTIS
jgi:hypothetical protein